jgi:hypothetical protein
MVESVLTEDEKAVLASFTNTGCHTTWILSAGRFNDLRPLLRRLLAGLERTGLVKPCAFTPGGPRRHWRITEQGVAAREAAGAGIG